MNHGSQDVPCNRQLISYCYDACDGAGTIVSILSSSWALLSIRGINNWKASYEEVYSIPFIVLWGVLLAGEELFWRGCWPLYVEMPDNRACVYQGGEEDAVSLGQKREGKCYMNFLSEDSSSDWLLSMIIIIIGCCVRHAERTRVRPSPLSCKLIIMACMPL